jgi:diacylglycerol kinase family enzyme
MVVIQKALSADHQVSVAETSRRGHATRLAQGAARSGVDAVVVLGGDGTLNEAANGLAGTGVALGVLPGGSTNVFARTIGMTNDPIEATGELLAAMAAGSRRRIGLGQVNGRYFLFHVGIGFDAAVVEQVERHSTLKRWLGHPLFVYASFLTWFRHYDRTRPRFVVEDPDVEGYFALCLNTNPYTNLGNRPFNVAAEATFDRGLVLVTFRSFGIATLLHAAGSALGTGRALRTMRKLDRRVDVERVVIRGLGPFPYQMDGDFLGPTERLEFRHVPDALDLFVP